MSVMHFIESFSQAFDYFAQFFVFEMFSWEPLFMPLLVLVYYNYMNPIWDLIQAWWTFKYAFYGAFKCVHMSVSSSDLMLFV